jgi:hypothetical protein
MFYISSNPPPPSPSPSQFQTLTGLIKNYKYRVHPRSYAVDLTQTLYVLLCMMEADAKGSNGTKNKKAPTKDQDNDLTAYEEFVVRQRREEEMNMYKKLLFDDCADSKMVLFYCWLLRGYQQNSEFTNQGLFHFLAMLATTLDLEPMLYQISLLRVFQCILGDAAVARDPKRKYMTDFCTRIVRNVFNRWAGWLFTVVLLSSLCMAAWLHGWLNGHSCFMQSFRNYIAVQVGAA